MFARRFDLSWFVGLAVACAGAHATAQVVLQTFPLQHVHDKVTLLGDIDGDGVRDVAFARYSPTAVGGNLEIYSTRTGALLHQFVPPPQHYFHQPEPVGDVDGDGGDDISHLEYRPNGSAWDSFSVIRSGRTGAYVHEILWAGSRTAWGLDDLTGDGRVELLLSHTHATVGGVAQAGLTEILDGATLQVLRSHAGTYSGQGLTANQVLGDIDGDGVRDYLLEDEGMWAVNPLYGAFSGATGAPITAIPKLTYSYGLSLRDVGDVNADGYDDIILADHGNPIAYPYRATHVLAGPSFTQTLFTNTWWVQAPPPAVGYFDHAGRVGDFDGDGHADFVLSGGVTGDRVTILAGRDLSTLATITVAAAPWSMPWPQLDSPGDFDGGGFRAYWIMEDLVIGVTRLLRLVSGAPPGVTGFGAGCADRTGGTPVIGVGVGARLGKTMTINLSNANPALLAAVLGIGNSATAWNGVPLPVDLGFVGLPGCKWYIAGDVALVLPTAGLNGTRHHATYELAVPANNTLLGLDLFSQWLVLEAPDAGLTGATTRAMRTTVVP